MPGEYGELILSTIIGLIGFLLKRSIDTLEKTVQDLDASVHGNRSNDGLKTRVSVLEERADEHDTRYKKTDEDIAQVIESIKMLTATFSKESVKNAETAGRLEASISRLEALANKK